MNARDSKEAPRRRVPLTFDLASAFILAVFFVAAFAPFLANEAPIFLREGGRSWSPVVSGFDLKDVLWLALTALFPIVRLGRGIRRTSRPMKWMRGACIAGLISALAWVAVSAKGANLGTRPWSELTSQVATLAVWPPIRHGPTAIDSSEGARLLPPITRGHVLGTDGEGRDVLSRMIHGLRTSLHVGFLSAALATILGLALGIFGGFGGRAADALLRVSVQIVISIPVLFGLVALQSILQRSLNLSSLVLGLLLWPSSARLVRSEALWLRKAPFVEAARNLRVSGIRIAWRHFLPFVLSPALFNAGFLVATAILAESALSFLGLGAPPPTPSLGELLRQGRDHFQMAPWLIVLPGIVLTALVLALQSLAERVQVLQSRGRRMED